MDKFKRYHHRFINHLFEVFLLSGIILLFVALLYSGFERMWIRSHVVEAYSGLHSILSSLQAYSVENPSSEVFPPAKDRVLGGIVLCPLKETQPAMLHFLTTPVSYIETIPSDPFISQAVEEDRPQTPLILHWVRLGSSIEPYRHIAWGGFSIGPALVLPPTYQLDNFRKVTESTAALRRTYYNPSNGLRSLGILYQDSMGNTSEVNER
ncbi:hypothetical protein GF373_16130 [bacterium]|nr:hypothetical protein [bacterium]